MYEDPREDITKVVNKHSMHHHTGGVLHGPKESSSVSVCTRSLP